MAPVEILRRKIELEEQHICLLKDEIKFLNQQLILDYKHGAAFREERYGV